MAWTQSTAKYTYNRTKKKQDRMGNIARNIQIDGPLVYQHLGK